MLNSGSGLSRRDTGHGDRIQARAIRRCGELLKQIEPARGHENGRVPTSSGEAAKAGLSEHQRKTALRVASIPDQEFHDAVEADGTAGCLNGTRY